MNKGEEPASSRAASLRWSVRLSPPAQPASSAPSAAQDEPLPGRTAWRRIVRDREQEGYVLCSLLCRYYHVMVRRLRSDDVRYLQPHS